ncbi:aminopeptidase P family protein [Pikeienuella sp. HZG-20]|uniref:aminopeptidase P family protein n=1 Tax=Paludibacillus litoralis TaxID=3133267 RepID=UPI0030EE188F
MFQDFTDSPSAAGAGPLPDLRAEMNARGLDGFIIPRADAHQGEYVPPADARLAFMTGFTGSAGVAVALAEDAAIFVDGRYTLQAEAQVDGTAWRRLSLHEVPVGKWIAETAPNGARIGFDPWLHGKTEIDAIETALSAIDAVAVPVETNPVDAIWRHQPAPPAAPIRPHAAALAGEESTSKRARIGAAVREAGADAAVLTLPDSIAWLLNIRGGDIPRNPVPLVFAILRASGETTLFIRAGQDADPALAAHLGPDVRIAARADFPAALQGLGGENVLLDRRSSPLAVAHALTAAGAAIVWGDDPCVLPKAIKTSAEIDGARAAHLRDAAAVARFLAWLDREAPSGRLTEIAIAKRLEAERRATNALMDISFDTIAGAGPHGAIVHYRVTEASDRTLSPGELMLVDSGGQYIDGTTDITRTIAVGTPPEGAIRANTLVLKGMIAVSTARFPPGVNGRDIDTMARAALWRAGFDYDHGTGHGIGAYLCVHEGPQSLSRRGAVPLRPGMMVSNEPGYYRTGAFGIRIENLLLVEAPSIPAGGDRAMMGFETLTLAPIDRRLIDPALLSAEERAWLDAYHARVRSTLKPLLDERDGAWLEAATAPLQSPP